MEAIYISGDRLAYVGSNVTLVCHSNGQPSPIFSWYLRAEKLKTAERLTIDENQLFIFNVTIKDNGQYVCEARNSFGKVSAKAGVTVLGKAISLFS